MTDLRSEAAIQNDIVAALQSKDNKIWENYTGTVRALTNDTTFQVGDIGSPDIILIQPVTVTAAMVGKTVGLFVGIEVKDHKGTQRETQEKWQANCDHHCQAIYILARSVPSAKAQLQSRLAILTGTRPPDPSYDHETPPAKPSPRLHPEYWKPAHEARPTNFRPRNRRK